jgi:glycosyltransferase involved in cell wall biosynthesis
MISIMSFSMKKSACIVIPAYNEGASIQYVLDGLKKIGLINDTIVVDDGSSDNTAELVIGAGASLVSLGANYGSGTALIRGYREAIKRRYTHVIQLDADGQHSPSDIPRMVAALNQHQHDLIIGSRYVKKTGYRTPLLRRMSILLLSLIIKTKTSKHIYDPTSGFRAFNRRTVKFVVKNHSQRCSEAMIVAGLLSNGYSVSEVSVEMSHRIAGKSKLTLLAGIRCLIANITVIIKG